MLEELASSNRQIEWIICYISEAHAVDEWPISSSRYSADGKNVCVKQTRTIDERLTLAQKFVVDYKFSSWKLMISPPEGDFELIYKPWPFRIYGFEGQVMTYAAEPRDCEIRIEEVYAWVDQHS